jgi:hypothetical protein
MRGRAGPGGHHSSSRPPREVVTVETGTRRIRRPAARRRGGTAAGGPCYALENQNTRIRYVSLGIYGQAVRRPAYRDAKVRTLLATAEEVLGPSGEAPALRLADDAGREYCDPAVVLVSNNPYALDNPLAPGTRPALDTGRLGIVVLGVPGDTSLRPGRAWGSAALSAAVTGDGTATPSLGYGRQLPWSPRLFSFSVP